MEKFDYTVETLKNFNEAVKSVEQKTEEKGFKILYIHDITAGLAEKGFEINQLKIIEICNAKYASLVLSKDMKISLMLPCPISVFRQNDKTYISALRPAVISDFYPDADIGDIAKEIDNIILDIVNSAV